MPRLITVPASVDSSQKLQTIINSTGNVPTEFVFSEDNNIEVSSPIRFYPGVKLSGNGATFHLKDRVSRTVFPSMVPILGAKASGGTGFEFSGLVFDGNSDNQTIPLGKGYDNFIGLTGASNILIHDIYLHDSAGDVARLTNAKVVRYYKNKIYRCGHDGLYVDGGYDVEADDNYTEIRTNSAIRLRHVKKGRVRRNVVKNKVAGRAACPGFQFETSTTGRESSDILVEDNDVSDTYGPMSWVVCTNNSNVDAAADITFRNNIITNCGNMDYGYHDIPGVGGIVVDCWNKVLIEGNKFKYCLGYGVLFGEYINTNDSGTGYTATVRNNTFIGTRKSNSIGEGSGAAIANVEPKRYAVTAYGNKFSNNVRDLYNVEQIPETVTTPEDKQAFLMFKCSESQLSAIKTTYPEWTILRKNDDSQ